MNLLAAYNSSLPVSLMKRVSLAIFIALVILLFHHPPPCPSCPAPHTYPPSNLYTPLSPLLLLLACLPGPDMENAVDRESHSLAAGLCLGMILLAVLIHTCTHTRVQR